MPEDKIHFTTSEFARIQSNLVRMSSTALSEDVDISEKDFETFLSHVEDSIVSGESHVEKGEYEIATEKYDKTFGSTEEIRCAIDILYRRERYDITICSFENAVASLLSSRASCFVNVVHRFWRKDESKLHRAIRVCLIGLEGKEHIKSDVVETLEYWIDQARKNMPVKEDDDGGDVPGKEDRDEIEDTPFGETKKLVKSDVDDDVRRTRSASKTTTIANIHDDVHTPIIIITALSY